MDIAGYILDYLAWYRAKRIAYKARNGELPQRYYDVTNTMITYRELRTDCSNHPKERELSWYTGNKKEERRDYNKTHLL